MPTGKELLAFADAAAGLDVEPDLDATREHLADARQRLAATVGDAGVHEAAATIAIFNGLVRVADGTGIQLDAGVLGDSADFRAELGIDGYAGAANTATTPAPVDRSSVADLFA